MWKWKIENYKTPVARHSDTSRWKCATAVDDDAGDVNTQLQIAHTQCGGARETISVHLPKHIATPSMCSCYSYLFSNVLHASHEYL